jgi:excinuclease ABC subunit C
VSVARLDTSTIPDGPGVYLFRDAEARAIYVGKATSLRKRLASYWGKPLHPRTEAMMAAADSVEWIVASNEVDALMHEYNHKKEHHTRFKKR